MTRFIAPRFAQCWRNSAVRERPSWIAPGRCIIPDHRGRQPFHSSARRDKVVPYMLADIGEGITECLIVEWFVEPETKVQQFDKICEVQSDKASVEITSRFDGTIKALHYATDDMAIVGKPLVDIDVEEDALDGEAPTHAQPATTEQAEALASEDMQTLAKPMEPQVLEEKDSVLKEPPVEEISGSLPQSSSLAPPSNGVSGKGAGIATPAVRHLLKQLNLNIGDIPGTGKDGRVRKEDIDKYVASSQVSRQTSTVTRITAPPAAVPEDQVVPLSNTERQMFKVMTESLTIPHFLYSHSVNATRLFQVRSELASQSKILSSILVESDSGAPGAKARITALPFIMKAISHVLQVHPKLNAHLDTATNTNKPQLILKGAHNFGIAVDTPNGLLVPVVKNVERHSIVSLAAEIDRLSELAKAGKLSPEDFRGATFSVTNVGSIGGGVVSPVIVSPMVAIVGVGRAKKVPVFETNSDGEEVLTKRNELVLSWSADHRVLDGATVARCAEAVGSVIENIQSLGVILR